MNAVGIFLGRRAGEGYSVNILSTSRRRDRIVVVFEERMPPEIMMAQRAPPPPLRPARHRARAATGFARRRRRGLRAVRHGRHSRPPAAHDPVPGRPADLAVGDHPDPAAAPRPADLRANSGLLVHDRLRPARITRATSRSQR